MNVAGAIHSAGSRQLKDFTWGEIVVNIINSLVEDPIPPVTIESTGKSIIQLLDKMSNKEKNIILSYPISIIDEEGEFIITDTSIAPQKDPFSVLAIATTLILIIIAVLTTYVPTSAALDSGNISNNVESIVTIIKSFL